MAIESKAVTLSPLNHNTRDLLPLKHRLTNLILTYKTVTLITVIDNEEHTEQITGQFILDVVLCRIDMALCSGYAVTYHYTVT